MKMYLIASLIVFTNHICYGTRVRSYYLPDKHRSDTLMFSGGFKMQKNMQVLLRADSVQAVSDKGLQFSIIIANTSENELKTFNPLDFLFMQILNDNGKDVFINQQSKYTTNMVGPFEYAAFIVSKVLINGKSIPIKLDNEKFISIPAKAAYQIILDIPLVWSAEAERTKESDMIKIPKGMYTLTGAIGISKNDTAEPVFLNRVKIIYGI